ncbi:N-acetylmuramidase domain-containing protein [Psychrobacter glaciei]|uniref:N-acetylmuramidase domain-containing protein n=1 Tax=Psychrobacter glaciei TaxID=619771 RepID=UPI003F4769B9
MARTHVIQAQTALASAGFYNGKIDGDFGGGSLRAVESMIDNTGRAVNVLTKADGCTKDKPRLGRADIIAAAKGLGVEAATLKTVIDVEARSSGFDSEGRPTILFERHKMWKYLGEANYFTKRDQLNALFPDICNQSPGDYNARPQYEKLAIAESLHWEAAHKSASFGLGQIMGFNAESLGYPSLKAFVDAMYESEAKQLDAMCRYIKINNLVDELQRHDWAGFAKGYNGSNYAINQYDVKLAAAYKLAKKQGW